VARLTALLLMALAALLQATLGGRVGLGEGRPDLALLLVIAWAVQRGIAEGVVGGVFAGLCLDVLSGAPFGLNTLLLAGVGCCVGVGEPGLYRSSLLLLLGAAFVATLLYHVAVFLALQALGWQVPAVERLVQVVVPTALLNVALVPLAHWAVRRAVRATSPFEWG
jgi:rod shape-determining protein MreD